MAGDLVEGDGMDAEVAALEGGDLVAGREGDGRGDGDVDEEGVLGLPAAGHVDVQVAAEVDADAGRSDGAGGGGARRAAGKAGLAEEGELVVVGVAEDIEGRIVREGEEPLAAGAGAVGDVGHPVEDEGLEARHRVPAGVGAVDPARLGGRVAAAVAGLEDVRVDREEPEARDRLDEVGGVDDAPAGAAADGADLEAAGGEGVAGAEGAFPVQVVGAAEEAEVGHGGERSA